MHTIYGRFQFLHVIDSCLSATQRLVFDSITRGPQTTNFDVALCTTWQLQGPHDDVIKWKHFPRYWPFVLGIHRSPVNSPHKSRWRGALMFSLICAWIKGWVNNRKAGDLRCNRARYDVSVMWITNSMCLVFMSMYMLYMEWVDVKVLTCIWSFGWIKRQSAKFWLIFSMWFVGWHLP